MGDAVQVKGACLFPRTRLARPPFPATSRAHLLWFLLGDPLSAPQVARDSRSWRQALGVAGALLPALSPAALVCSCQGISQFSFRKNLSGPRTGPLCVLPFTLVSQTIGFLGSPEGRWGPQTPLDGFGGHCAGVCTPCGPRRRLDASRPGSPGAVERPSGRVN